jgi:glycogen synthase
MNLDPRAPRRILMTADPIGGVWTYAMELALALAPYRVEIALATMGAALNHAQLDQVLALDNVEVFESSYKLEWMEDPWLDVARAGDWLLELESRFQPELVHLNGFAHGALPWRVPHIVAGHSCVLSWWRAVKHADAPADWNTYRANVYAGLQGADFVIAPSHAMLNSLEEFYGPLPTIAVIPNGRRSGPALSGFKQSIVFASGRLWDEAKNVSALAEVAPQLSWPVYVAGEAQQPDGVGVSYEHVRCLGVLDAVEMQRWFRQSSIYALPARYEPFGLSILEAALAGCALVLGDIPSLRENWNDAALFVAPDDSVALRGAIEELISNPGLRSELSVKARCVAGSFTPERMAKGYLAAYEEALDHRSSRPNTPILIGGVPCVS